MRNILTSDEIYVNLPHSSFSRCRGLELCQMNVKTTFLTRWLHEEIYMDELIKFEVQGQERKVCMLKVPIYYLK